MINTSPLQNRFLQFFQLGDASLNGEFILFKHLGIGTLIGYFILHPLTMALYWFEFNSTSHSLHSFGDTLFIVFHRVFTSFNPQMLPMALFFALLGSAMGLGSGLYYRAIMKKNRLLRKHENEFQRNINSLIQMGENDRLEFKAAVRWDLARKRANKDIEFSILKTIVGFMNSNGGTLIIGINDSGQVVGLDQDYTTFKRKNRDGFEQHLMKLISSKIGKNYCVFVHVIFHDIEEKDICQVCIDSTIRPAYLHEANKARFFLRTGNITNELDAKETVEHIAQRS